MKKRPGSPYYFATFRDAEDRRKELSTGAKSKHAAVDAALLIIKDVFAPPAQRPESVSWEDAIARLKEHAQADNLRPGSIMQYVYAVNALRKVFPEVHGPAEVTPAMAEQFKVKRMAAKKKPRTVAGNIDNLSIVFDLWFRKVLKIIDANPFADVEPPKYDKPRPRVIAADEKKSFFDWLRKQWDWELPILFLETEADIGCRITELASLKTEDLKDGRIRFPADKTKGRKERTCLVSPTLFKQLQVVAGPVYVFEAFCEGLRQAHLKKGNPTTRRSSGTSPHDA
ncbi:MAG: hypothetical protein ABFD16_17220 [Thermoguttaceae bacterium]